jgi:hypothetical protein
MRPHFSSQVAASPPVEPQAEQRPFERTIHDGVSQRLGPSLNSDSPVRSYQRGYFGILLNELDLDTVTQDVLAPSNEGARALAWLTSLQDRNLNAVEIGWPFRLGLEGCIVDRSQDIGWQRAFGHGSKIVPELLQRRGADDDAIIAFCV